MTTTSEQNTNVFLPPMILQMTKMLGSESAGPANNAKYFQSSINNSLSEKL